MEKISRGELKTICIKINRGREQQRGKRKKQQFWFREEQKHVGEKEQQWLGLERKGSSKEGSDRSSSKRVQGEGEAGGLREEEQQQVRREEEEEDQRGGWSGAAAENDGRCCWLAGRMALVEMDGDGGDLRR